jgi:hypothetical protein
MTVSFTTNRTPSPAILAQVMRVLEATAVQVQEDAPADVLTPAQADYLALAYQEPLSEEARAEVQRIVLAGTDGNGIDQLIGWYEEDRQDRSLPGRV